MRITFCGAAKSVTGSCYYLDTGKYKILVDFGMFQGRDDDNGENWEFAFDPAQIDYLFLTHAHIDHCGRLPMLIKRGFKGKIVCTKATKDLCLLLLKDSATVQKHDFKKCKSRGGPNCEKMMLYSKQEVDDVLPFIQDYPYGDVVKLSEGLEFRMRDAGHILGSAIMELWVNSETGQLRKFVFSGDLGQPGQRMVVDPDLVREADYVVVESTYGNRMHKSKDETMVEFIAIIKEAQRDKGNILIPSFAVERSQEILYELNLFVEKKIIEPMPVYFDSPLAQKATEIFKKYPELYDEDARRLIELGDDPFMFEGLQYVKDFQQSKRLVTQKVYIVIAGSGMCNGGRILYHLENNLEDPTSHLIFAGYQVQGTLGRELIDGAKSVKLSGNRYNVNIKIHTLGSFSAHGDQKDLEYWLRAFGHHPRKVFFTHGDEEVISEFKNYIDKNLKLDGYIPEKGEVVNLD
ncbi:MAG: MBL fold metallo-hydrolase [bacterium]